MKDIVRLGFEVGSGTPVHVPIRHMCIAGQTQEAGKTTALEGLISRSGLRAITFITKRGEGSFTSARRIRPYFREQADWQFVASILEASRGEKLKFERAWIIRASKGAKTLADVQANVRRAMTKAKGLSADVYLTLDAYLDAVVPTIGRVQWAKSVELSAGVNAMDLTGIPDEMQHLVIKSTIDWVLQNIFGTIVVIPEAWKFIPQGRGTPVKLSAEAFIRQAAGLKNYLWLDSQDIGGIEKTILRSVPVWVLGVQREANEIKRTLTNIPAGTAKPSPSDIATLELGQFYACWQKHVIKTYAQPAWCNDLAAEKVATGALTVRDVIDSYLGGPTLVTLPPGDALTVTLPVPPGTVDVPVETYSAIPRTNVIDLYFGSERADCDSAGENMTPEQEKKLDAVANNLDRLVTVLTQKPPASVGAKVERHGPFDPPEPPKRAVDIRDEIDNPLGHGTEALYQSFKARFIDELKANPDATAALIKVVVSKPELRVKVERQIIEVDGSTTRGRIARLIVRGFFETAQTSATIGEELAKSGPALSNIELGNQIKSLVEMGFFRRDNKWITLVPEMIVNVVEG